MTNPEDLVLTCDFCDVTIDPEEGALEFQNAEGVGYPREPSPILSGAFNIEIKERHGSGPHSIADIITVQNEVEAANPVKVSIVVYHFRCLPDFFENHEGYQITLDRLKTGTDALVWLRHLMEKNWFGNRDAERLLDRLLGHSHRSV